MNTRAVLAAFALGITLGLWSAVLTWAHFVPAFAEFAAELAAPESRQQLQLGAAALERVGVALVNVASITAIASIAATALALVRRKPARMVGE